jgi:hypothetical protein
MRIHVMDCFAFESPLAEGELYAQLLSVYDFEAAEKTRQIPWLYIEMYEPNGDKDQVQNIVVRRAGKYMIPFGYGYNILPRVHLCSVGKLVIVNRFCVSII